MQMVLGSKGAIVANPQEEEQTRYCSWFFLWDFETPKQADDTTIKTAKTAISDANIRVPTDANGDDTREPDLTDLDFVLAEQRFLSQMRKHRQQTLCAILCLAFLIVGIAVVTDAIVAENRTEGMGELPNISDDPYSNNLTQSVCSVEKLRMEGGLDACIDQCASVLCCSKGKCEDNSTDCSTFRFCIGYLPEEIISIPPDAPIYRYDNDFDDDLHNRIDNGDEIYMRVPTIASLVAGSLGGAMGVLTSFPFDTLKTLAQSSLNDDPEVPLNLIETTRLIWQKEGLRGFYKGVRPMMIGQSFIKALAFGANALALNIFATYFPSLTAGWELIIAAAFSGFVTGFFVTPVERIKIMMQASSQYVHEFHCIRAVMRTEGCGGLFGRGLGPTMIREIPGYAIYFAIYGALMETYAAEVLGYGAPCVFGAVAGCLSWLPVYPIDVVKTLVQNTEGGAGQNVSWWVVTKRIYKEGGVLAFFDGLSPKMIRATIYNAFTFLTYELVIRLLGIIFGFDTPRI
jgi:hypothetical protein